MSRKFRTANYEEVPYPDIKISEVLPPPEHLARFVVDTMGQLDISPIYQRYSAEGGEAIAPEALLGLLFTDMPQGCSVREGSKKAHMKTFRSLCGRWTASRP